MLMEHHHHTQGRPSWTPSLYSASSMAAPAATSTSLAYDSLRPPAYPSESTPYQSQQQQYPQDQDSSYRYPYSEMPRPTFAPLPPPPRDDPLAPGATRLRYPPPSLPLPMIGGSLSPHIRMGDKLSSVPAVVTPAFTIAKPGGLTTPKRATDEERRAKHREAQRRFVKRKKIEMTQLKQLAVELEKRHDLLQAVSEREALARENQALVEQLEAQKEKAQESPTSTNQPQVVVKLEEEKGETPVKEERPRTDIKWEPRTFEW
ncbi:hypothetical protein PR003_g23715 [Phytophthora rubi]|uniref:BZIP domain-containing protein n=1 Tax=Phytophthora rubi TaxID=129364 RepID=A0A6A4D2I6_9STRA|nr:hypothetical protein PR001_g22526 [Phytophthora rubi]KAE9296611.1 hypothetical protein PR003_g23715 [Phytophthora rubi]